MTDENTPNEERPWPEEIGVDMSDVAETQAYVLEEIERRMELLEEENERLKRENERLRGELDGEEIDEISNLPIADILGELVRKGRNQESRIDELEQKIEEIQEAGENEY